MEDNSEIKPALNVKAAMESIAKAQSAGTMPDRKPSDPNLLKHMENVNQVTVAQTTELPNSNLSQQNTHEQNMEFFHKAVNEYEERNKNTPPILEPQIPGEPINSAEIELEKINPPRKGLIARIMGMFSQTEKVEPINDTPPQKEVFQAQEPVQLPNPGARIVGTPESDARNYLKKPTPPRGSTG